MLDLFPRRWKDVSEMRATQELRTLCIKKVVGLEAVLMQRNPLEPTLVNCDAMKCANDAIHKVFSYEDAHPSPVLQEFATAILKWRSPLVGESTVAEWLIKVAKQVATSLSVFDEEVAGWITLEDQQPGRKE